MQNFVAFSDYMKFKLRQKSLFYSFTVTLSCMSIFWAGTRKLKRKNTFAKKLGFKNQNTNRFANFCVKNQIEDMGLACLVLNGQDGPAYLLPASKHNDQKKYLKQFVAFRRVEISKRCSLTISADFWIPIISIRIVLIY